MATRALASSDGQNGASAPKPAPVGRKTSAAKLASLDWQPPASPATTMRPQSVALDLGRAIERGLGGSLGATPAFEQELWEVRSEIEKAKLRHVAPFPFFGKAMRFQDEFAALQITDDGRFSYSFVDLNYEVDLEGADQQSPEDPKVSRVLTYEGVLISPVEEIPQEEAEPEAEGSARIEGLAMAKHEIEDVGGRAQLMSISRSSSRFAIVVSPYFQPNVAVVYSLHLARSPRRPRRTQLAYVGRGMKRELHSTTRNGDVWRLTQQRRRAPKPKFSKSGSTSMLPAAAPSKRTKEAVKHMNQMMLYSKIVTIRDAQIQEKRMVQGEREEEERHLDAMMEIERLKALKMYEVREQERLQSQRSGAKVIIEQIKDRQAQRMKEEEQRDQERAFVLKQIESLKAEEVEQQQQKKLAAERLMQEVNEANSAAMKIKEEKMLAEKLEEQKIIEYQEAKEARERELEAEKVRLAADKERETARLRAMQEKAQDKAAEMDALRAKRAMEAAERTARQKEQAEKDKIERMNADLKEARLQQQAEKERRLGEQAKFERDEFERIIEVQMQQEEAERQRQVEEHQLRVQHSQELRHQIAAREEKAYQERRDFLEEGNAVRASIGNERKKLEKIKARKIDELKKSGVPEKYWAELARKKISI